MVNILLLYTVMDAWREKYHSICITDDTDHNVVCIDCQKGLMIKETVSSEIIEQIREKIISAGTYDLKYKSCSADAAFSDGVINHFFINDGEKLKEIEIQDLSRVSEEKAKPLMDMMASIKDLLIPKGIDDYYFSLLFE